MSKKLKIKYETNFASVRILINLFDPCGLINAGAPSDEYDVLVNKILSFTYDNKTSEELKKMIVYELEYYYGCFDLSMITESEKIKFYENIDELLNKVEGLNLN
jgi:hypothetical protein